ncbi:alpha-amylase family protein [Antarcticirhabdus aurantiaca]|uniref:Alpha-amylase family protein n=1 Tax=Antarcticirhabdus aurantiaca TaxID=2606717 RepID=A0ACD4NUA4_9HYPH|nr:alpha-amylase family protein [Antarcticirhabdus aurantiaca]WAJ30305.1 alpha-amylase family protein [Jeongeuplla avenae]
MLNLWYKNAVIYCLDVETFADGNGDGVGDFRGLADRLGHIEALGATCIWLLPFYPTPNRDNGYDVTDYYGVDPRLGTLGDFVAFTHAARDHGLKVIVDLVLNHSSIDHPWFQASRSDPDSPYRDWYVWRKDKPADAEKGVIFPGVQESTWTFDRKRGEYYFHRFYKHQADLNIANPAVREEIERIMAFWLQLGVSGFRLDAVPFMLEDLAGEHAGWEPERYLAHMQQFLSWRRAEAIMLAEANIPMEEAGAYFGDGDRLHMVFNFPLNQKLFLGLARRDAAPVAEFLQALPEIPPASQWATFLRNHDEIDLGRLSDEERAEVFAAFGPDESMQIYERGIRRRLAPMLGGDERRIQMAMSLMLSLPGTPVIWYGDEIGMGENLDLPERHPVRTPMQWSAEANGGFSSAAPDKLVRPPVSDGPFAFSHLNVEEQEVDPDSTLTQVERLIRARRAAPEIGWSQASVLDCGDAAVIALAYDWRGSRTLTLHNLAEGPRSVTLPADLDLGRCRPVISREASFGEGGEPRHVRLGPYGYAWLRLS